MAAPGAHIFLALQVLAGPLKNKFDEKEFIIGTSFPDIRYLNGIGRHQTHFENVTLSDVMREPNSFKAGMLFHSLVDEKREEYMVSINIYASLPTFRFTSQSLKFAEDQIMWPLFDVKKYSSYLDTIIKDEKEYGIAIENLQRWHEFLHHYFKGAFSVKEMIMRYYDLNEPQSWFIKRLFFSWYYGRKMKHAIQQITTDDHARHLVLDFYHNFSKRLDV